MRRRSLVLALLSCIGSTGPSAMANGNEAAVEAHIWAQEEAYFARLYRADYDGVLALVHGRFLGWPGSAAQPIDRDGSVRFMRQLVTRPTSCTVRVERGGIQVLDVVALTQFTLHATCPAGDGPSRTQSSRITHTWVREAASWRLLGGMSDER